MGSGKKVITPEKRKKKEKKVFDPFLMQEEGAKMITGLGNMPGAGDFPFVF